VDIALKKKLSHERCPWCHDVIWHGSRRVPVGECAKCGAVYHAACTGACITFGCGGTLERSHEMSGFWRHAVLVIGASVIVATVLTIAATAPRAPVEILSYATAAWCFVMIFLLVAVLGRPRRAIVPEQVPAPRPQAQVPRPLPVAEQPRREPRPLPSAERPLNG
jgi:hypothetical protein